MSDQTLTEFLYAVITEQRKSISTLVDALNEAKNGISQLTTSAERSEESRRQVEAMLEQQSTVESDLKFDLTQCRQQNEVLQGQVKMLEENLESTEKLRFDVTCDRDLLQDTCERHAAKISAQSREITMHLKDASVIKGQLASTQETLEKAHNVITTQNRDILKYQDEIATLKLQLAGRDKTEANSDNKLWQPLADAYVRLQRLVHSDKLPDGIECTPDNVYAFTEQRVRELIGFRKKVISSPVVAWTNSNNSMLYFGEYGSVDIPLIAAPTLAAGTLDCSVPAETPTVANEIKAGTCIADEN